MICALGMLGGAGRGLRRGAVAHFIMGLLSGCAVSRQPARMSGLSQPCSGGSAAWCVHTIAALDDDCCVHARRWRSRAVVRWLCCSGGAADDDQVRQREANATRQ